MDNYKEKYLKYKKKYLQLKGGSNCPKIGFHQHIGECWHDSFLTNILFSDGLSENIQKIFDTTEDYSFNLDDCMKYALENSPKCMIPLNIEEADMDNFLLYARQYIQNVYERYQNEKLDVAPQKPSLIPKLVRVSPSVSVKPTRVPPTVSAKPSVLPRPILVPKQIGGVRYRRDSVNESLACNYSTYALTNINNINKKLYKNESHGGNMLHNIMNTSLINYFLLNYNPLKGQSERLKQKYINLLNIDIFTSIFHFPDSLDPEYILNNKDTYIRNVEYIKSLLTSDKLKGIMLNLNVLLPLEDYKKTKERIMRGHVVSLYSCGGQEYFYDDNGVESEKDMKPDDAYIISIDDVMIEKEEHPDIEDELKTYNKTLFEKKQNRFMEYKWKDYLINKIEEIIEKIRKNTNITADTISDFYNLFRSFSDLFYGHSDKNPTCGRKYLQSFYITSLDFIFESDFVDDNTYLKDLTQNNKILTYSNERTINTIINYRFYPAHILGFFIFNFELLLNTVKDAINNNNIKFVETILNKIKSKEEITETILAIKKINEGIYIPDDIFQKNTIKLILELNLYLFNISLSSDLQEMKSILFSHINEDIINNYVYNDAIAFYINNNYIEFAEFLLNNQHYDPNKLDQKGMLQFSSLILNNEEKAINIIFRNPKFDINKVAQGYTYLTIADTLGRLNLVKIIEDIIKEKKEKKKEKKK